MNALAYVIALYGASRLYCVLGNPERVRVVDALAINWLLCEAAARLNDLLPPIPAYIVIDAMAGIWLAAIVRTGFARWVACFYLATVLFNASYVFAQPGMTPMQHYGGLALIAWAQIAFVFLGAWRDGVEAVRGFARIAGMRLNLAGPFRRGDSR